ncbi:MAG TPA: hypothetical protein VM869_21260, partial [Enhygromyxa sp.]|nr:hypothetical protein [Enhygromyxa sp.]
MNSDAAIDRACALFDRAREHRMCGDHRDAREQIDRALALLRRHAGREHPDVAHALIFRAELATDQQAHG